MMASRLRTSSEERRGSAVFTHMLTGTDPLRGRPVGGSGVHPRNCTGCVVGRISKEPQKRLCRKPERDSIG
jgi:hypothetical protein